MKQRDAQTRACIQSIKQGRCQKGDVHRFEKTGLYASTSIWKKNVPSQGAVPGSQGRMCVIVSGKPQQALRLEMVEGEEVG